MRTIIRVTDSIVAEAIQRKFLELNIEASVLVSTDPFEIAERYAVQVDLPDAADVNSLQAIAAEIRDNLVVAPQPTPPESRKEPLNSWGSVLFSLFAFAAAYMISGNLGWYILASVYDWSPSDTTPSYRVGHLAIMIQATFVASALWIYAFACNYRIRDTFMIYRLSGKKLVLYLLIGIIFSALSMSFRSMFGSGLIHPDWRQTLAEPNGIYFVILGSYLFYPFLSEMYSVRIVGENVRKFFGFWGGAAASSLVGFLFYPVYSWSEFVLVGALGLIYFAAFRKEQSLTPCLVMSCASGLFNLAMTVFDQ